MDTATAKRISAYLIFGFIAFAIEISAFVGIVL
jgi:hypothetical protein